MSEAEKIARPPKAEVFYASLLCCANAYVALLFIFGANLVFIPACVMYFKAGGSFQDAWPLPAGIAVSAVLGLLAYFPGNLGVLWPCAVEVDPSVGLRLFGPMKTVSIPTADVYEVEQSFFWQGYVVRFSGKHGLLGVIAIPFYFGPERTRLIQAIKELIDSRDS